MEAHTNDLNPSSTNGHDLNNNNIRKRVCVIGSGAAGLCVARHLTDQSDLFEVVVYEQTNLVGGTWNYNKRIGTDEKGHRIHSSMYQNLKTNIPLNVMEFPDFVSNEGNSEGFVGHREVLQYLQDYCSNFGLKKYIKFYHSVEQVKRIGNGVWSVTCLNVKNGKLSTEIFDSVVVCNGRYSLPKTPNTSSIVGLKTFTGEIIHSHDYRSPKKFEGKNVLIVGAGPSGIDISLEIADEKGSKVHLCHMLPDTFKDLPLNIIQHAGTIEQIDVSNIHLTNGTELKGIDAIIFATGYLYDFTFLDENVGIKVTKEGRVENIYLHLINMNDPTMFIFAIPQKILPFPLYHQQACLIKKVLKGETRLPSKEMMMKEVNEEWKEREKKGIPERHSHKMNTSEMLWNYDDRICSLASIDPIKPVIRNIFESLHIHRKNNSRGYKNLRFKIIDDETFEVIPPSSQSNHSSNQTVNVLKEEELKCINEVIEPNYNGVKERKSSKTPAC